MFVTVHQSKYLFFVCWSLQGHLSIVKMSMKCINVTSTPQTHSFPFILCCLVTNSDSRPCCCNWGFQSISYMNSRLFIIILTQYSTLFKFRAYTCACAQFWSWTYEHSTEFRIRCMKVVATICEVTDSSPSNRSRHLLWKLRTVSKWGTVKSSVRKYSSIALHYFSPWLCSHWFDCSVTQSDFALSRILWCLYGTVYDRGNPIASCVYGENLKHVVLWYCLYVEAK